MIIGSFNIIVGWNALKRRRICDIIKKDEADIFMIQETKFRRKMTLLWKVCGVM